MPVRPISYLALFLVTACPIICRAALLSNGCGRPSDQKVASAPAADDCCAPGRSEEPERSSPPPSCPAGDSCVDQSCFCSAYVVKAHASDLTSAFVALFAIAIAEPAHVDAERCTPTGLLLHDPPESTCLTADARAALPLLI
jgi:hypothetical protein